MSDPMTTATAEMFLRQRDEAVAERDAARTQRDHWIRLFNRLEAAISHHKRDSGFADANDESLWYARDRILKEASGPIPED